MGTAASAQASEQVLGASPEDIQAYLGQLSPEERAKLEGALAAEEVPAAPAEGEAAAPAEATGEVAAPAGAAEEVAAPAEATEEAAAPAEATGEAAAPAEATGEAAAPAEATGEAAAPAEATGEAAASAEATGEAAAEGTAERRPSVVDTACAAEGAPDDEPMSPPARISAPHLAEYFDKVQKRTAAMVADQEKLMALALDPEAKRKFHEESAAWFEAEAKPLLVASFKHHDKNETGTLEPEEAAKFFKRMVEVETDFAQAMSAVTIEAGVAMSLGALEGLSDEERETIKPFLEEEMRKNIEAAQAEVQKKEDNYRANKAGCDVAAFEVLDTNKEGKIGLVEFLAAFEPDSAKNVELHIALGYVTKEEIEEQSKRQEQVKEQAGGCAQQ